jgi:enediyne biosynthesis protein E4
MSLLILMRALTLPLLVLAPPRFVEMREGSGIDYVNVTGEPEKRFIVSSLGTGAALFDYDQDGDLDLYLVNGSPIVGVETKEGPGSGLYRNQGGFRFEDATEEAGVGYKGFGQGCAVADVDNDGFPDLYVTGVGENVLYRNRGDGTFEDVTDSAGVGYRSWGTSAAFFDADGDGDLDLYLANYADPDLKKLPLPGSGPSCRWLGIPVFCGPTGLVGARDVYFRNDGDGRFVDRSRESGILAGGEAYGLGVVAGDYDGDGDADVYVANDSMPDLLFQNDGTGHFDETGLFSGVAYNTDGLAQAGMGVDFGDLDGDGNLDLFVTTFSHDTNTAYRNLAHGVFADATTEMNLRVSSWFYLGWGTRFVDLDNDGDEDLFVANGHVYPDAHRGDPNTTYAQRNQIFWNRGEGKFDEGSFSKDDAMAEVYSSRGAAFGDLDDDGDTDVSIVNIDDQPSLLRNDVSGGHWIGLRLVGTASNRDALGARVVLTCGALRQTKEVHTSGSFLSSSDPRLLFGLGNREDAVEVRIRWPGGREEVYRNLATGRYHLIVEGRSSPNE